MLCRKCGMIIAQEWPYEWHTTCWPDDLAMPGQHGMSPNDLAIKHDMIEIVRWAHNNATRSLQTALGCSEAGHPCDRRIGYKMAGIPPTAGFSDPWPAVVGTAIHSWMESAVNQFQEAHGLKEWVTEMEVWPNPLVKGHTDLYRLGLVLDYKFPSPDNLKVMREKGPSAQYMTQVQLYGLGHHQAGRRVDRVGIIACGRQGWLKDMYVHTVPFDVKVGQAALQRVYALGHKLNEIDILSHPELWDTIPATPDRLCNYCPFFDRNALMADDKGCPGS